MDDGTKGGPGGADGPGRREQTPVLEVTLHEVGEDLKLTPEQQPLFDVYAKRVRALASDTTRDRQRQKTPATNLTVVERIDRNVDMLRNRLTAAEDIAEAAKALYSKLIPEQQRIADPRLATLMLIPLSQGGEGAPMKPPAR